MAKRKAASRRRRKTAPKRAQTRAARSAARRTAARKRPARKRPARKTTGRKTVAKKAARHTRKVASTPKVVGKRRARSSTRPIVKRKITKKVVAKSARKVVPSRVVVSAPTIAPRSPKAVVHPRVPPAILARDTAASAQKRKLIPGLNRERRTIRDDDDLALAPPPSPPSSLDLNRSASSARSGRRGLREKFDSHTETSPAITGGDVDADWESAYSVGDEAPGGDSPTPDQDIVDDIGRAVGVEYQDNEELKGEKKISDRDKHRWELDPASAEDYDDR